MATLRFLKAAWNDYVQLDGSQKKWVNQALHQLKTRGGEIGQRLSNTQGTKLHG